MWVVLSVTSVVLGCMLLQPGHAAPKEDLVTNVPGLGQQPPFKQYSGYLHGDGEGDRFLHYWFVESSSDPRHDPLVLWMNGGPGCSGIMGLLMELGPYKLTPDGSLDYNPMTWNQAANIIYLESPVGVGYSYSKSGNIKTNDSVVAIQNTFAVKDFFRKFPEYMDQDFYLAGESYAGIYVPTLASLILDIPSIKLKGFLIGNALSSYDDNRNSLMYFTYHHGLIGDGQWNYMLKNCCPESEPGRCNFTKAAVADEDCAAHVNKIHNLAWKSHGLDVYNLYRRCDGGADQSEPSSSITWLQEEIAKTSYLGWEYSSLDAPHVDQDRLVGKGCTNYSGLINYMNRADVQKALHVKTSLGKWSPCSSDVSAVYTSIYPETSQFYLKAMKHELRLMLYNGDVDMACNFLGDEWFVDRLPLKNPGERKFWYYRDGDQTKQIGGLVKTFDLMTLVTVKGSGHKVPQDKPRPALEMFINYIQDKPFMV